MRPSLSKVSPPVHTFLELVHIQYGLSDLGQRDVRSDDVQPTVWLTTRDIMHTHPQSGGTGRSWPVSGKVFNALDIPKGRCDVAVMPAYMLVQSDDIMANIY